MFVDANLHSILLSLCEMCSIQVDTWSQFLASRTGNIMFMTTTAVTAFENVSIAAVLIYYLTRKRTGFRRTDRIITVMIAYTVNTGVVTALASLLVLLTYCFMKDTFMFQGAYCLAGRAYGIAVIGTLTQRRYLRYTEPAIITDGNIPLSGIMRRPVEIFTNVVHQSDDTGTVSVNLGEAVDSSASDLKTYV